MLSGANISSQGQAAKANSAKVACPEVVASVLYYRKATWHFQDLLQRPRIKSEYDPATYKCGYTRYIEKVWRARANKLHNYWKLYHSYALADRDFERALLLASRIYNVSYSWLHSCAGSEGGFRQWEPNQSGSSAGGWMQFMSGTFYSNVSAAFATARQRGYRVPSKYESWYSRVGQAFTAAYMFKNGQSSQWTGAGC